jgi:hypothetical protein
MERKCTFCAQMFRLKHYYAKTQLCSESCRAASLQRGLSKQADAVVCTQMLHNGRPRGDDPRRLLKRLPFWMKNMTSVNALLPPSYAVIQGNRAYTAFGVQLEQDRERLLEELLCWFPQAEDVVKYVMIEFLIPKDTITRLKSVGW